MSIRRTYCHMHTQTANHRCKFSLHGLAAMLFKSAVMLRLVDMNMLPVTWKLLHF